MYVSLGATFPFFHHVHAVLNQLHTAVSISLPCVSLIIYIMARTPRAHYIGILTSFNTF